MKRLTRWIAAIFIKDYDSKDDLRVRARYGYLEGWVSIIGNILLFLIKIAAGIYIGSISLIADAIHTLSDSATSVVVILGFRLAKKPADKEHPFGHGRMEPIATVVVAVLLFLAGVELVKRSINGIIHPKLIFSSWTIIAIVAATVIIKELMARFAFELGDMIDSSALRADAVHHRTDVFAAIIVVLALAATRMGFTRVDGIAGVVVSMIIFYSAYTIGKDAVDSLLGEAPSIEMIHKIECMARAHDKVFGVHDIIFHKYGQTKIISLHIEVSDKESVSVLHAVSDEIEQKIGRDMGAVVVVHIDPVNNSHPRYQQIYDVISAIVRADKRIDSFHELRIVGADKDSCNVIFDVVLKDNVDEYYACDIISSIRKAFNQAFPYMKLIVKLESKYISNSTNFNN